MRGSQNGNGGTVWCDECVQFQFVHCHVKLLDGMEIALEVEAHFPDNQIQEIFSPFLGKSRKNHGKFPIKEEMIALGVSFSWEIVFQVICECALV